MSTNFSTRWKVLQRLTIGAVGVVSKFWAQYLNKTQVINSKPLLDLVQSRPKKKALITVSNHVSCCDDPMTIGSLLPLSSFFRDIDKFRWLLGAKEVCFTQRSHSAFFRLGKVVPVVRGDGVYQPTMNQILQELNKGHWLHIFSEGKINLEREWLQLRWGVGRLVADSIETPIVVPMYHYGMDTILPNTEPYVPQINKKTTVVCGEPIDFDQIVEDLKAANKTPMEMRKVITDKIQEEFYQLKEVSRKHHEEFLNTK